MSTTYLAAYYVGPSNDSVVLTGPEHATMSTDDLLAEAWAEAERADIVDMDEDDPEVAFPRLTKAQFEAGLEIGDWTE